MKKFIVYTLLTLVMVSCGAPSGHFRIEGRLRNFNQGEFYVYSPDGGLMGIDTIRVSEGRFRYETKLADAATFVIVFPNFSEQVVFGESGATATVSGDASHLKEMEVEGTDDNEKMTEWRMMANRLTPPEVLREAEAFIKENPLSPISAFLLRKYFVETLRPDFKKAEQLARILSKANPKNNETALLAKAMASQKGIQTGCQLPKFSAIDINGKKVDNSALKAKVNIVTAWASWSYESQSIQRMLNRMKKEYGGKMDGQHLPRRKHKGLSSPRHYRLDKMEYDMQWKHVGQPCAEVAFHGYDSFKYCVRRQRDDYCTRPEGR